MNASASVATRVALAVRGVLPRGQLLDPEVWERRHRGIVIVLWLHAAGLTLFGVVRGFGVAHTIQDASLVAVLAMLAGQPTGSRRLRASAAVLGLVVASAVLVHLSGGATEAHFHFFVVVGIITLYQDWVPFGLALAFVVVHHGLLGVLHPTSVYDQPAAWRNPWKWALIHGVFVLAASVTTWSPGGSPSGRRPRSAGWSAASRGWPEPTR